MTHRYAHYTYSITNKASILLLCALIVAGGSLLIKLLCPDGYDYLDILKRIAWPVWGLAFVIRLFEALIRRFTFAR